MQMPDYKPEIKSELCDYLVNVFQLMIGEGKDILSDWGSVDSENEHLGSKIFGKNSNDSDDQNDGI